MPTTTITAEFRYVDSAVGGWDRRNHVIEWQTFCPPQTVADCGSTYFRYDDGILKHFEQNRSVRDYSGSVYTDRVPFDIDREGNLGDALIDARALVTHLATTWDIEGVRCWFSGHKGFAIEIPAVYFGGFAPSPDLPTRMKRLVEKLIDGSGVEVDTAIYEAVRLWRQPNTKNGHSGLYKVPLTAYELLSLTVKEIKALAVAPREIAVADDDDWDARPELVELWAATALPAPREERAREIVITPTMTIGKEALDFIAFGAPSGDQRSRAVKAARNLLSAGKGVEGAAAAIWRGLEASIWAPGAPWTYEDALAIVEDLASKPAPPPAPLRLVPSPPTPNASAPTHAEPEWPAAPDGDAFFGQAGAVVARMAPYTEASPVALLVNILTMFGAAVGAGPHMLVAGTKHPAKLFVGTVGPTAVGRKGEATSMARRVIEMADPTLKFVSGMSSGEGLIHAVRDPLEKQEAIREKGKNGPVTGYQMVVVDEGVADKRAQVVEAEIARVFASMARSGNTLSPVLRDAWDTNTLRIMTRNAPETATGSHIAVIAHVTPDELRSELSEISVSNGLANRFVWICSRRAQVLPDPASFMDDDLNWCVAATRGALVQARAMQRVQLDAAAMEIWKDGTYAELSGERGIGLRASLLARAPQNILRLALAHALLNVSQVITADHLIAAMALWDYSERSVTYLFGDRTGNVIADSIYSALRQQGEMSRTAISDLFGRNRPATAIDTALQLLITVGKVRTERRETDGRTAEIWMVRE